MKKSIIFVSFIFLVCIMLSGLTMAAVYERSVIDGENDKQVAITVKEYTGFHKLLRELGLLSVSVYPSVPMEGENFKVVFGGALPDTCINPFGRFEVWDEGGVKVRIAQIDNLPTGGASIMVDAQFRAPAEGDYKTFFEVRSSTPLNPICLRQEKSFSVEKEVTECPSNYCDSWEKVTSVYGGELYERYCYEYGSAPTCRQGSEYEEKIVCKNDFYLSGSNCVKEQTDAEIITESTNSEDGIISVSYPDTAKEGEAVTVKMSFKAPETREYYLEAGFIEKTLTYIGSQESLCDGNKHWSGVKVQGVKGQVVEAELYPLSYDAPGRYHLVIGAYTDCLSEGGEAVDKVDAYLDIQSQGSVIKSGAMSIGVSMILVFMALAIIFGGILLYFGLKK